MSDAGSGGLPPAANSDLAQKALLVGGALGLLALAAFLGYQLCTPPPPPPTVAAPELEVIEIVIDKSCAARIDANKTANQKERDILVWRIDSECANQQKVLICTHPQGGAPALQCLGDPRKAVLETSFTIDAATSGNVKSYIVCPLEWPTTAAFNYKVELLTENEVTPLTCQNKDYELALDVVP